MADSAQKFLKDRADPPVAVFWWPGRSYVSCDGGTAINTGPWVRQWGKSVGYFTTVWQRQANGSWKWLLDHGDALTTARGEGGDIKPKQANCATKPADLPPWIALGSTKLGSGRSVDGTLQWHWSVEPDGSRTFEAILWNGSTFETVIEDKVAAE